MNAEGCCCFVGVNVGVKCRCKYCFGGNVAVIVAVMPMYMSEKNVGDMSVICRKEKHLKTNVLSFYVKLVTDNKCRRLCR